jgi:elongation factor G
VKKIIDSMSAFSDEITDLYLAGSDIPNELLKKVIRKETIDRNIVPVFVGSSLKNKGVQQLLDGVLDFLPSPEELLPIKCIHAKKEEEIFLKRDKNGPLVGYIFKIQQDREMGSLCFVRIYSGSLKSGTAVMNINKKKRERVNRILRMHSNSHEQISSLDAGDIAVIVGMKSAQTGDSIGSEGYPILLDSMVFSSSCNFCGYRTQNS